MSEARTRLAIVSTHPIQYYAPWFRRLAADERLEVRVFYLWDFGVRSRRDSGFGHAVQWDVPLLDGYEHEFVPNRSRSPGTDRFSGLWNPALGARVRAFAPDAVVLFGYNFASLMYFIARWNARAPLLLRGDSHRLVPRRGAKEALRRLAIAAVFRRFAGFLYVGSANRDYYAHHRVPARKLFLAPHAVDNERFRACLPQAQAAAVEWKRELGIPDSHRVVLFAGKWEAEKRPLDLVHAFRRAGLADVSLLMVGAGGLADELREAARGVPHVHWAPFQNQTLMPRTYCAGDVFVLPSGSETWGLAVNEAMCMRRAVIVSDLVGCARDLVVPGRNGLVYPAGDVDALAQCLRDALSDPARLAEWGERSGAAIDAFSYERATAGLLEALLAVRSQ